MGLYNLGTQFTDSTFSILQALKLKHEELRLFQNPKKWWSGSNTQPHFARDSG